LLVRTILTNQSQRSKAQSLRVSLRSLRVCVKLFDVRGEFIRAISDNQSAFGLQLTNEAVERLAHYYELVQEHNGLLHLVGPCSTEEFAVRHILESLSLLKYLRPSSRFADVGAGAGLPSIPCLLVRDDVSAVLIESK